MALERKLIVAHTHEQNLGESFALTNLHSRGILENKVPVSDGNGNIIWQDQVTGVGKIILYRINDDPLSYDVTAGGLTNALSDAVSGNSISIPVCHINGNFEIPSGVVLFGQGGSSVIEGSISLNSESGLFLVSIRRSDGGEYCITTIAGDSYIRDCSIKITNSLLSQCVKVVSGNVHIFGSILNSSGYLINFDGEGDCYLYYCKLEHVLGLVSKTSSIEPLENGTLYADQGMELIEPTPVGITLGGRTDEDHGLFSYGQGVYIDIGFTPAVGSVFGFRCSDGYISRYGSNNGIDWYLITHAQAQSGWRTLEITNPPRYVAVICNPYSATFGYGYLTGYTYVERGDAYVQACDGITEGGIPLEGDRAIRKTSFNSSLHTDDIDYGIHHTLNSLNLRYPNVTVVDSSTIDLSLNVQELTANVKPEGIKLDDLGTPDDNTDLNATSSKHGLLPKLSNVGTQFLNGLGQWVEVVSNFLGLSDTPNSYSGQSGKYVKVKSTEDGLEFGDATGGHTIENENGDDMTQRTNLQFVGSGVSISDDGVNDRTVITIENEIIVPDSTGDVQYIRKLIYDKTLSSDGEFDFKNVPQIYDHLEFVLWGQIVTGSNAGLALMRFNGDTDDTHYETMRHYAGSSHGANIFSNTPALGIFQGSTQYPNFGGRMEGTIISYADSNLEKSVITQAFRRDDTYPTNENASLRWTSTSPITRIQVQSDTGFYKTGTRLQIFGVGNKVTQSGQSTVYTGTIIYNDTLDAPLSSIDIPIQDGYDSIKISINTSLVSGTSRLSIQFNDDNVESNYRSAYVYGTNSGSAGASENNSYLGSLTTYEGTHKIEIQNVSLETRSKVSYVQSFEKYSGSVVATTLFALNWNNPDSINKITLKTTASSFVAGTVITVIGYKNTKLDNQKSEYILIRDEKPTGTDGGYFPRNTWVTRDVNTIVCNTGNHASVSSNQINLKAGSYRVNISVPALYVTRHQAKLYNITNDTDLLFGSSELTYKFDTVTTRSIIQGRIDLSTDTTLEIRHKCEDTSTWGLGAASNISTEIYTIAEFWRGVDYEVNEIKLDDLATPDDNTDLNATDTRHGLLPKLSGSSSDVLLGNGTWGEIIKKISVDCDASNSTIINHNWNTRDIFVSVRDTTTNEVVYPNIVYTDLNNITINFSFVPTSGKYKILLISA